MSSAARRPSQSWPRSSNGPSIERATSPRWWPRHAAGTTRNCSPSSTPTPSKSSMTTSSPNLTGSGPSRTPLYAHHLALGGRMVDFGGWELPQQYTSIRDEHLAVRKVAGLFDISHMGRLYVDGPEAESYLQRLFTNDLAQLAPGHAMYNLMCRADGGVVDDLVVYRQDREKFLVVVNAANREKDVAWMREHLNPGASFVDRTAEVSLIAFQGPRSAELLPKPSTDTEAIPYFGFRPGEVAGISVVW